jgi:indole-3-glycerol phosphate synthase
MSDILNEISSRVRHDLDAKKASLPESTIAAFITGQKKPKGFRLALDKVVGIAVIAELKQASPSAGVIRKENDVLGRIHAYEEGGASAVSILTEEHYFHGSVDFLRIARKNTTLPLLRKDFVIDPYQIAESRALGADAVLLIAALLDAGKLKDFLSRVEELGMDGLVEVHDESELQMALESGASLIGINNRNLHTLQVDPKTSLRLLPMISGRGKTVVIESGISATEQLMQFQNLGAKAVLIGEVLMRSENPAAAVRTFVKATK